MGFVGVDYELIYKKWIIFLKELYYFGLKRMEKVLRDDKRLFDF